jgi:hypothetical protein
MPADETQVFDGFYVAHWEVARFVATIGKRFFGLLPRTEAWQAHFPEGFCFPDPSAHARVGPTPTYRMTVRGRLGPAGRFGHMGICRRELFIDEVLACERLSQSIAH